MKKTIYSFLVLVLLLGGCANQENIEKANAFWMNQFVALLQAKGMSPAQAQRLSQQMAQMQALRNADNAAQAQPSYELQTVPQPGVKTPAAQSRRNMPQSIEVTMEDDVLPGIAPLNERQQMTDSLNLVRETNQELLNTLGASFSAATKNRMFALTSQTERQLKKEAARAKTYAAYSRRETQILQMQDTKIQQIIQEAFK